jgi:cytochrome c oxidase subunit 2
VKHLRWLTLFLLTALAAAQETGGAAEPRTIAITAKRFEFSPSTITLKKGETVKLLVTSEDVTHGFFLRPLKLDLELSPGQTQEASVTPLEAGTYTAICHHFCGAGHGNMKLRVVVEE